MKIINVISSPIQFILSLSLLTFNLASANRDYISNLETQACTGMYQRDAWGGSVAPFISTNLKSFGNSEGETPDISIVVFEYKDISLLGYATQAEADGYSYTKTKYVCDSAALSSGYCSEGELGSFIYNSTAVIGKNSSEIKIYSLSEFGVDKALNYHVLNTGYYCVASYSPSSSKYKIDINFRNSFGNIAASEYPKLTLYAVLAICYAASFAYYGFQFWKHKHEILPLQKYFLSFFIFLTVENVLIWSFYDLTNRKGERDAGVKVYMVFISLLNSIKFTFSFFLLLVICLGYGIVYPKLDKSVMLKCKILAGVHFVAAVFYSIANYLKSAEKADVLAGISSLPITIATAVFYVVTLKSLTTTTQLLASQKQIVKLKMYRHLFRIIFTSLIILILGVFVSSFVFLGLSSIDLIEQHWKTRFFYFDFWPSLVYFVIFNLVAFIWRPTDTSYMLVASQQLPTDPSNAADFELDDVGSLQGEYENVRDDDSFDLDTFDHRDRNTDRDADDFEFDIENESNDRSNDSTAQDESTTKKNNSKESENPFADPENPFTQK
ncbi:hypothetical protein WICPIJ_007343 [Wickerhamomyces pijperi]|uniref:Membrane protein PTM1 n=1 Tax=Wickerhamomyces pijperi TaxID=599730 RepID=A0A9P8Q0F5_WICPI|nr:hypothetical protein WICPIJ_007343 [Wickerhamomyces pijperi]